MGWALIFRFDLLFSPVSPKHALGQSWRPLCKYNCVVTMNMPTRIDQQVEMIGVLFSCESQEILIIPDSGASLSIVGEDHVREHKFNIWSWVFFILEGGFLVQEIVKMKLREEGATEISSITSLS